MGFWQFATGGGSGGGSGDVVGPASATDNAIARFDGATGKLLQNSDVTISDLAAGAVTITAGKGTAITLKNTNPDATTGASVAGDPIAITAGDAVASTDTAGAAAGGAVTITAGAAARFTSGNANGGDINLTTGAGVGTGTTGKVVLPSAAQLTISTDTGLARSAAGVVKVTDGGAGYGSLIVGESGSARISFGGTTSSYPALRASSAGGTAYVTAVYADNSNYTGVQAVGYQFGNGPALLASAGVYLATSAAGSALEVFRAGVHTDASTAGSGAPKALAWYDAGGNCWTNEGTTTKSYFTLPTAVKGYLARFVVQDADGIRITANTSDTIRVIDKVTAAAGYIESTTIGSTVTLIAINATEWIATAIHGVWTDGTFTYDDTSLTTP